MDEDHDGVTDLFRVQFGISNVEQAVEADILLEFSYNIEVPPSPHARDGGPPIRTAGFAKRSLAACFGPRAPLMVERRRARTLPGRRPPRRPCNCARPAQQRDSGQCARGHRPPGLDARRAPGGGLELDRRTGTAAEQRRARPPALGAHRTAHAAASRLRSRVAGSALGGPHVPPCKPVAQGRTSVFDVASALSSAQSKPLYAELADQHVLWKVRVLLSHPADPCRLQRALKRRRCSRWVGSTTAWLGCAARRWRLRRLARRRARGASWPALTCTCRPSNPSFTGALVRSWTAPPKSTLPAGGVDLAAALALRGAMLIGSARARRPRGLSELKWGFVQCLGIFVILYAVFGRVEALFFQYRVLDTISTSDTATTCSPF